MSTRSRKDVAGMLILGMLAIGMFCAIVYLAGFRFNSTKSIPLGVYQIAAQRVPARGDYVIFCPPEIASFSEARARGYIGAGFCPGNFGYLMKKVLAAKGDRVRIASDGVYVNNRLLPLSAPFRADGAGRVMPVVDPPQFTISDSNLLLMSDVSGTSFDGRYFGPIERKQIRGVIRPIWTWKQRHGDRRND